MVDTGHTDVETLVSKTFLPAYPLRLPTYLPRPRFAILWFSFDATGGPQYDLPLNAHLAPQTRQVDYIGCTCRKSRDAWPAGLDSRFNLDLSISRCARGLLMRLGAFQLSQHTPTAANFSLSLLPLARTRLLDECVQQRARLEGICHKYSKFTTHSPPIHHPFPTQQKSNKKIMDSTPHCSRVVPHPSTERAQTALTSLFG